MLVAADTHVHLFPVCDLTAAFRSALEFLPGPDGSRLVILYVADREGFPGALKLLVRKECWKTGSMPELSMRDGAVMLRFESGDRAVVVSGRQIVSAERIEALALASPVKVKEGAPIREILAAIEGEGGVPVLPWSPGKWSFARGKIVERIVEEHAPENLFLGDIFMRPAMLGLPKIMQRGLARGLGLLAGSDPLAAPEEERLIGRYGIAGELEFGENDPLGSARAFLTNRRFRLAGIRAPLSTFVRRMLLARRAKARH